MPTEKRPVDRSAVAKALSRMSFDRLKAEFEQTALTDDDLNASFELMERCGSMFFRRSSPAREAARNAFVDSIERYLEKRVGAIGRERAAEFRDLVVQIEAGYRDVDHGLRSAEISSLPRKRQLVAVLQRAGRDCDEFRVRSRIAIRGITTLSDPVIAQDAHGQTFEVDGTIAAYIGNLGTFLKLLAGRFDPDRPSGPWRLPVPVGASEEDMHKAATNLLSASAFRRWRRIEERRRFLGGCFLDHRPPNLPEGVAPTIEVIREFRPRHSAELLDWIANERMKDLTLRQVTSARYETVNPKGFAGVDEPAALAPEQFVSLKEQGAYMALTGLMSTQPFEEKQCFQGLTLAEWIRGYATLSIMAGAAYEREPDDSCRTLLAIRAEEIQARLCTAGLSETASAAFVRHVTLGDHSDDMFDCPLLALEDERFILFALAAVDVDPTRVVLSNLTALGESFEAKGPSFERQVLQFFRALGFAAFSVDTVRGGEQYQIDALVPWDGHLFLFECKNEWLSEVSPVATHNFEMSRRKHVRQILRQADGIRNNPDILVKTAGIDPSQMTIVPVLLYAFPYAAPDLGEGVYVSDWSSLTRFFSSRDLNAVSPRQAGSAIKLRRHPIHRQWEGKRPAPSDLLRQLKSPIQVIMMGKKAALVRDEIWLADHRYALSYEWRRKAEAARESKPDKALVEDTRRWREAAKRV